MGHYNICACATSVVQIWEMQILAITVQLAINANWGGGVTQRQVFEIEFLGDGECTRSLTIQPEQKYTTIFLHVLHQTVQTAKTSSALIYLSPPDTKMPRN